MQNQTQIEWLNLNSYRSYPFVEDSDMSVGGDSFDPVLFVPDNAVLDYSGVQYGHIAGNVVLSSYTVGVSDVTFVFELADTTTLSCIVPLAANFPYRTTVSAGDAAAAITFGTGVLTLATYGIRTYYMTTPPVIEPALITILNNDRVNQLLSPVPASTPVVGDVYFKEGYNCRVTIVPVSNVVRIAAVLGAGKGQDCSVASESTVTCPKALLRINGLHGGSNGEFAIVGGESVTVTPDPDNHVIVIKSNADISANIECGGD